MMIKLVLQPVEPGRVQVVEGVERLTAEEQDN